VPPPNRAARACIRSARDRLGELEALAAAAAPLDAALAAHFGDAECADSAQIFIALHNFVLAFEKAERDNTREHDIKVAQMFGPRDY